MTNRKNTKRALFSSVISLILCLSMLIGTTFAWFTDSVSSGVNQIVAGNLDVDVYYGDPAQKQSITGVKTLFNDVTLWEPGAMAWEQLTVVNLGSLALKYKMTVNFTDATDNGNGKTLADVLQVAVMSEQPTRENIQNADLVLMKNFAFDMNDKALKPGNSDGFYMAIYWEPSANDNEYNMNNERKDMAPLSINLGLNVVATQLMAESDSFDNTYDQGAEYLPAWNGEPGELPEEEDGVITITNPAELAAFAQAVNGTSTYSLRAAATGNSFAGKTVVLANDINLAGKAWTPIGACNTPAYFQGTFDGQGHTIYGLNVNNSTDTYEFSTSGLFGWIDAAKATIKNVNISGATVKGSHWVGALVGYMTGNVLNCSVTDSTVIGYNVNDDANGDKVGGMIGYMNSGNGQLNGNSVSNTTVIGYRDVGGLAGAAAVDNSVKNNAVSNTSVLAQAGKFGAIISAKTDIVVDSSNVASGVTATQATEVSDGALKAETEYYIYDVNGLTWFANEVNQYSNYEHPFQDETVYLMCDLDLGGMEWTPIGDYRFSANRFCGTFDGRGNTVSNFQITKKTDKNDSNKSSYGFFGNMEGTVKNLTVDNATVSSYAYVGALVGRLSGGSVMNCHVTNSTVECSYWQAGGMIGQLNEGCTVSGCTISNTTVTGASAIGGMFGPLTATGADKELLFENCQVIDCAVIQKGSFGESYDNMFGAMFADIDVADNLTNINNCTVTNTTVKGESTTALYNTLSGTKVYFNGYAPIADGLGKKADSNTYSVSNANGLEKLNAMMADKSAGKNVVVNLDADIDFAGKTWTPVDSHADTKFTMQEINGNGHTIFNLTINGQAMFTRFAGSGDVTVKDITFDNATVNSTAINSSILTVQSYQNVLLDNVDVTNSTITGSYKVAPLIATVYNESSSTVTATLKNCDVSNTTVKATSYDFCTTGMVAFVFASDNDKIEFENCTVTDVKLCAPNDSYKAHAAIYTTGSGSLFNEAEGVTVTNVTFEAI